MNANEPSSMNPKFYPLYLCALATLLCSCAATSVRNTWKSPDCKGPAGKTAVLTLEERPLLRQGFENRLVGQLRKAGTPALTTFNLLSFSEIKEDKRAAAERLRANGAEALIVLRMVDAASSYREVQLGRDRYAGTVTGFETTGWWDYCTVAFMDMSPTYGSLNRRIYLETILFDLRTEKRLWSGMTETVLKERMDAVAEMDPLVKKILNAMRKDGVIQ